MTAGEPRDGQQADEQQADEQERARPRRLVLGDPVPERAGEDRPESWGERSESDADRLAHYQAQRPPHHGD